MAATLLLLPGPGLARAALAVPQAWSLPQAVPVPGARTRATSWAAPGPLAQLGPWLLVLQRDSAQDGLPWQLTAAVALTESSGDPAAVSPTGSVGLLQVNAAVWGPTCGCDLRIPAVNLYWGMRVLAGYARLARASRSCLASGPWAGGGCAVDTDEALSFYAAGPSGGWQQGYVEAVRRRWVEIEDVAA